MKQLLELSPGSLATLTAQASLITANKAAAQAKRQLKKKEEEEKKTAEEAAEELEALQKEAEALHFPEDEDIDPFGHLDEDL